MIGIFSSVCESLVVNFLSIFCFFLTLMSFNYGMVVCYLTAEKEGGVSRRMTRGATGVKPRQRIVISSDEEDDTPAARRTLSKLRSSLNDDSDSD